MSALRLLPAAGTNATSHRRGRWRVLAAVTIILVIVLAGAAVTEMVLVRRDAARYPAPGEFVELADGRRLHVLVAGVDQPGPTVVFDAGAGSFGLQWAWVQRLTSEFAPTVAYDRPGLGWSDPYARDWDASTVAADLAVALDRLGLPKPYVLVGHSLGGIYARVFAESHPDDVAGLVLVDPAHEHQYAQLGDGTPALRAMVVAAHLGILRATDPFDDLGRTMPPEQFQAYSRRAATAANARGFLAEGRNVYAALVPEMAALDPDLGDLPLTVLRAEDAEWDGTDLVPSLQAELPDLSTRGELIDVAGADHYTIVTEEQHARTVTEAIRRTIEAGA